MSVDRYDVGRMADFGNPDDSAASMLELVEERDAAKDALAAVTKQRDRLVEAVDRYILANQRWDELTGRDPDEWSYVGGELESAREHLATLAASIKGDTDPTPPA